ncbi:MAG: hypothetical protein ABI609_04515 [Acidobacteriota bacterium]
MDRETVDEIKRHFGIVAEDLRSDLRLLADGVASLAQSTRAEFKGVREEIGEVKAMIRLSYRELDGRLLERVEARVGN